MEIEKEPRTVAPAGVALPGLGRSVRATGGLAHQMDWTLDLPGSIYEPAGRTDTDDERFTSKSPASDKRLAVV